MLRRQTILILLLALGVLATAARAESGQFITALPAGFIPAGAPIPVTTTPAEGQEDPYHPLAGVAKEYRPGDGERSTANRLEGFQPNDESTATGLKNFQPEGNGYNTSTFLDAYNPKSTSPADGPMKDYQKGAGPAYY